MIQEKIAESETHYLKTWDIYFRHILDGKKKFEIRKNDRDYHVGDTLVLQEYDTMKCRLTGREIVATVNYVLLEAVSFGLQQGYCIMSISTEALTQDAQPDRFNELVKRLERLPKTDTAIYTKTLSTDRPAEYLLWWKDVEEVIKEVRGMK